MDLAKCKICGERHRAGPCPKFQSSRGSTEGRARTDQSLGSPHATCNVAGRSPASGVAGIKSSPREAKFDRATYQRDYMRKRRAAEKIYKNNPTKNQSGGICDLAAKSQG